uniref:Uncharacterized protein n=2 Tax=Picea TaxID=3328 RepID=A0A101LXR6_PICGL|nr:hypothetical protein ABT39_MTgene5467 [Picea glauca]QHR91528.1 hypothetical protein Q903MT_gene5563 [Picea sitchensis]
MLQCRRLADKQPTSRMPRCCCHHPETPIPVSLLHQPAPYTEISCYHHDADLCPKTSPSNAPAKPVSEAMIQIHR